MSYWLRNSGVWIALALLVACSGDTVPNTTVVIGTVSDTATGVPLEGVEVLARSGAETRASSVSRADGSFQLQFDTPAGDTAQAFTLSANLPGYRPASDPFVVLKGKTTQDSYSIRLVSDAIASCTRGQSPAVVIGHFRAPLGQPVAELSDRIAAAMKYDLDEKVQTTRLVNSKRPGIFACGDLEPKLPERYGSIARYLGVDAFIGGVVLSPGSANVELQMYLADGYGFMGAPRLVTTDGVDLNDPRLSRLTPDALTAVMTALVVGYKTANKPEECVELVGVSERLLPTLPEALVRLREECQSILPNRGLL